MISLHRSLLAGCFVLVLGIGSADAGAGLSLQPVATGLSYVTSISNAGDGSGRLFVTQQHGRIMIVDSFGLRATPFLDIQPLVSYTTEQGLLGLAFHKNFATNHFFYVDYTDTGGTVVVARYTVSANDPNVADPASATVLLTIPHSHDNHNGGQLQFGPDGYLYIGSGDGGGEGDPFNEGQSLDSLLGKILRIDVDHGFPYAIPPTNPFYLSSTVRREIWAYGLRNPWRFSFDRATGDLLIADVGQYTNEEIDFQPAGDPGGTNYGWRTMEGSDCFDPVTLDALPTGCNTAGLTLPVMEYSHGFEFCVAVTGGYRYRGALAPSVVGSYVFGDFCSGRVWASQRDNSGAWAFAPVMNTGSFLSTFGEDESGELYVAEYKSGGTLSRIVSGTPAVSIGDTRLTEGDSATTGATFKVLLLPASAATVTVHYSSFDGTATAGSDYAATTGNVTFAPGATSATITVPVFGDTVYEPNETFSVTLANPVNASIVAGGGTGTATIVDDDTTLSINDVSIPEGDSGTTIATFTVTLARATNHTVTVDFATADGTALAGSDYVATSGTLTFTPGMMSATLAVPVIGNILVEPSKAFAVSLSNATNGSIGRPAGTGTILNDDAGPDVSIGDASVVEGDAGATDAVFTVSLSRESTQTVTVTYSTEPGSAAGFGIDYADTAGTLTFPPGVTTQALAVPVLGDTLSETNENFSVFLFGAANARLAKTAGLGIIIDDDPLPSVSVADAAIMEGDSGLRYLGFPVTLSAPAGQMVSVSYFSTPGTATDGVTAFSSANGESIVGSGGTNASPYPATLTVPSFSGPVRKVTVTVQSFSHSLPGKVQMLLVGPQGQNVILMANTETAASPPGVTFTFDDDGLSSVPYLTAIVPGRYRPTNRGFAFPFGAPAPAGPYGPNLSVFKGIDPVGTWSLYVLSDPTGVGATGSIAAWSVNVQTDGDYVPTASAVTFPLGSTTSVAYVPIVGDRTLEPDENFTIDLQSPTAATIANGHAVGTILNDDQPALTVSDANVPQSAHDIVDAHFTVSLDQAGIVPTIVDFATADGSAVAGVDYAPASGVLTFAQGTTTQEVVVSVAPGSAVGLDRTFFLNLTNPSGASLAKAQGVGTIILPAPDVSIGDTSIREGSIGPTSAVFVAALSAPSSRTVSVSYATADGTATVAKHGYLSTSGTLTFAPGATTLPVPVTVLGDLVHEPDQTFFVNLSNAVNATIADGQGLGTILNDDAVEQFHFSAPSYTVTEAAPFAVVTVERSGGKEGGVTVDYATADGVAVAGSDYIATSGTLTFGANRSALTIRVPIVKDTVHEGNETIVLRLGNPQHATQEAGIGFPGTAIVTITDNDVGGSIQFAPAAYSVSEGAGSAKLTVRRIGGVASAVTVHYATTSDTAGAGTDYDETEGDLTFGSTPGEATTQSITIPIRQDLLEEGAEAFKVVLSSPAAGATLGPASVATVTILDDEPTVEFSSATFKVREGQLVAVATVIRSGPLNGTASVQYATGGAGDTAAAGSDYVAITGVLTFPPSVATRTFTVRILTDTLAEGPETVSLNLSGPSGVALGAKSSALVTILDDDPPATIQFSSPRYTVNESMPQAVISVRRTGKLNDILWVDYAVIGGTVTNYPSPGADCIFPEGSLVFGKGVSVQTILVSIVNDALSEGLETAEIALFNPQNIDEPGQVALGPTATAVLAIVDDETTVTFGAAAYSVGEAARSVNIAVLRSGDLSGTTVVYYESFGGTATNAPGPNADYALPSGSLTFLPRQAVKTFGIALYPDTVSEGSETIDLVLGSDVNVTPVNISHVTIHDNDSAGRVQFTAPVYSVGEAEGQLNVTVTRSGSNASGPATVHYSATAGATSPASPGDFDATSGTFTFAAGEKSKTFSVLVHDNGTPDSGAVSVDLTLDTPGGGLALGATPTATLWIVRE